MVTRKLDEKEVVTNGKNQIGLEYLKALGVNDAILDFLFKEMNMMHMLRVKFLGLAIGLGVFLQCSAYASHEHLYSQIRKDFVLRVPNYKKLRKENKKQLKTLKKRLAELGRSGVKNDCAQQKYIEAKWLNSYTDKLGKAAKKISEAEKEIENRKSTIDFQSKEDGSWGQCFDEWFLKLDASSDQINDLAGKKEVPKYPTRFLDQVNSPEKLNSYLNSILISDVKKNGRIHRKEQNYSVSALMRLILRERPKSYKYHPKLKETLLNFLDSRWQNPETGYWGAWYRIKNKIVKTDDLSMTFHFVSYRKGKVKYLDKIAAATFSNRKKPYPTGLMESGEYTTHHLYDAARLWRLGWRRLDDKIKAEISKEISKMLDWCLKTVLQPDGSFKISPADDSLSDAFYFGVSFLDEVGYFNEKKRFWTSRKFAHAKKDYSRILKKIRSLPIKDSMIKSALEKLTSM